jgi:hypothetical protein
VVPKLSDIHLQGNTKGCFWCSGFEYVKPVFTMVRVLREKSILMFILENAVICSLVTKQDSKWSMQPSNQSYLFKVKNNLRRQTGSDKFNAAQV